MNQATLHLVVAHRSEASPLIRHFQLKKKRDTALPVYANGNVDLVITGSGKARMSAGVGYLAGTSSAKNAAWLNVGVAGHGHAKVGTGFLVNKVVERSTCRTWFPTPLYSVGFRFECLETVESPTVDYPDRGLVDMEGAAFCEAGLQFSTAELVQLCKVVFDNPSEPFKTQSVAMTEKLLERHVEAVGLLGRAMLEASAIASEGVDTTGLLAQVESTGHLTETQYHQVRQLVRRWCALSQDPFPVELFAEGGSREAIQKITSMCERKARNLGSSSLGRDG